MLRDLQGLQSSIGVWEKYSGDEVNKRCRGPDRRVGAHGCGERRAEWNG